MAPWLDALPLTILDVGLRPQRPWQHDEPALALRGAFGAAMMHIGCLLEEVDCPRCDHADRCLIPGWYDPGLLRPSDARPSWLALDNDDLLFTATNPLRVRWTFIGALPRPSWVVEAVHRAAALGLGRDRIPHEVELAFRGPTRPCDTPCTVPLAACVPEVPAGPLTLHTVSRLRLRRHGREISRPSGADVVHGLIHRVTSLERQLGLSIAPRWPTPPDELGQAIDVETQRARRFSSRQGRNVDLSGAVGAWTFTEEEAAPYRDLFAAAVVLHAGTATSAGLGRLRISRAS